MIYSGYNVTLETEANRSFNLLVWLCSPGPEPLGNTNNVVLGFLTCGVAMIGMVEVVVGCVLFDTFRHVRLGAWWVGVVSLVCILPTVRFFNSNNISLLLALLMAGVAFYGAFLDARSSQHFNSITACATQVDLGSDIIFYGKSSDYQAARSCFDGTEFTVLDGCYCVSNNDPGSCTELIRKSHTKSSRDDETGAVTYYTCYDTVRKFSGTMTASYVFCYLLLSLVLIPILLRCIRQFKR